jgi:hypothetical protein
MRKFQLRKPLLAEACTYGEYRHYMEWHIICDSDGKPISDLKEPGYRIQVSDGSYCWIPKKQFEDKYKEE